MKLSYKVTLALGAAVSVGLIACSALHLRQQERALLAQGERALTRLGTSVAHGLQALMLSGHAEPARSFVERLQALAEVQDLRILRSDGDEAFHDNRTIEAVNARLGRPAFPTRADGKPAPVIAADDPALLRSLTAGAAVASVGRAADGERMLTVLAPISGDERCADCHEPGAVARGVVRLTASLADVDRELRDTRRSAILILLLGLAATLGIGGLALRRTLDRPIRQVTTALADVGRGNLDHNLPLDDPDELGELAPSFNRMTARLRDAHADLRRENDKLATVIRGIGEGVVVTNEAGEIVLVNPAAERLLDRDAGRIAAAGFPDLFGNPDVLRGLLAGTLPTPHLVELGHYRLQIHAATIHDDAGQPIGSAAMLRDVTEEERCEELLRRQSATDSLTGVYNRRHLDETLAIEFHRAVRTGTRLSVLMLDIDHFRSFNDTHGHDQGDRVLQAVAQALGRALRKYDIACRHGGEEFVAILPDTNSTAAASVAERLRSDIERQRIDNVGVTVSIGIASTPELAVDTPEALLQAAAGALEQSKKAGRNRSSTARE